MRLISDSGGTKTDWVITDHDTVVKHFSTSGLNPVVMGITRFREVVKAELTPHIEGFDITHVAFYGAGCTADHCPEVRACLAELLPSAEISVASDLLGACRAVCGAHEGIVAILGTGSNSCLYDGTAIVQAIPSLGFILGDEGSGAALGKIFLNALLKKRLPTTVETAFYEAFPLTQTDILEQTYRSERPNTFLAAFAPFIHQWQHEPAVHDLIVSNFRTFVANNIRPYGRPDLPIHCVGGMAHHFVACLREAAASEGVTLGTVVEGVLKR